MNPINTLEQTEYLLGANLALENAKNHLEVSALCNDAKQYGIGTSLLILSIEELAKASVLKLKSINKEIPINNLGKYFYNHEIKHNSIIQVFFSSLGFSAKEESITITKKETNLFTEKINTSNIIQFAENMPDVIDQKQLSKLMAELNK